MVFHDGGAGYADLRDNHAEDFATEFGTAKNAFGKCVSARARAKHDDDEETPPAS